MKNIKKDIFDKEIKSLSGCADSCFGYETYKKFSLYFNNEVFTNFYNEMKEKYPHAFQKYNAGKGGELKEKNTRYGIVPPKMASIASSSRFIYLAFRDNNLEKVNPLCSINVEKGVFQFEDELTINCLNDAKPNLDASYKGENNGVYFEAKCHELFDSHQLRWKKKYFEDGVFFGAEKKGLGLTKKDCILDAEGMLKEFSGRDENIFHELKRGVFDLDEKEKIYFDIKQFVCHLLGIANDGLTERELVYIYFKPDNLKGFESEYAYLEKQFKQVAQSKIISDYCNKHMISLKLVYSVADKMEDPPKFKVVYSKKYSS